MNRFINRIVSARHPKETISREAFYREICRNKLVWFGEFHSEDRIAAFQNELLLNLASRQQTRLHVVLEHFSIEMQDILSRFQTDPSFGFDDLKAAYKEIGTEGHNLDSLKGFLLYCKQSKLPEYSFSLDADSLQESVFLDSPGSRCEIELHGGFLPRPLASRLNKADSKEGKLGLFDELYEQDFIPDPTDSLHGEVFSNQSDVLLKGSQPHFRLIQAMMSGQDLYAPTEEEDKCETIGGSTPIERLYQAQLLKDHAMGYHLYKLMTTYQQDRFLVVAGMGHLKHYTGVPECLERYLRAQTLHATRVDDREGAMNALILALNSSAMIGCQMLYETYLEDRYSPLQAASELEDEEESEKAKHKALCDLYVGEPALFDQFVMESEAIQGPLFNPSSGIGRFERPSCDYCFVYDEDDDNVLPAEIPSQELAKAATTIAYNQVGSTAGHRGNLAKAKAIMRYLQYTDHDLQLIGDEDLYNFQGVANPHKIAKISTNEHVLDIGSGLGVDSLLAASTGSSVIGVDIAAKQVAHASARAEAKGMSERLRFIQGDAESLSDSLKQNGLQDEKFDVCISNGAFCLIPDKRKALSEVYNALKPGGRMAISTTTIMSNKKLEGDHNWPVCMRMFANLESIRPMCEEIGFEGIEIIDAESPLEGLDLPEEVFDDSQNNKKRFKIHGKYADQYSYLEDMDMDDLCKVVTVCGMKPP